MFTHNFAFFLLLLQTPRAAQSRHPTCVVIHGDYIVIGNMCMTLTFHFWALKSNTYFVPLSWASMRNKLDGPNPYSSAFILFTMLYNNNIKYVNCLDLWPLTLKINRCPLARRSMYTRFDGPNPNDSGQISWSSATGMGGGL